jgi:glutaconyl-CoA/methylmalonyl-CoA decarboxylase subunit delta
MNLQDGVNLSEGLIVTLFSMGIVFLTLIIISLILGGFKAIFYKDDSKKTSVKKETPPIGDNAIAEDTEEIVDNDEEIVAIIAAAIAAHTGNRVENINVKNIRRIQQTSPIWMKAGRERAVYNKISKMK